MMTKISNKVKLKFNGDNFDAGCVSIILQNDMYHQRQSDKEMSWKFVRLAVVLNCCFVTRSCIIFRPFQGAYCCSDGYCHSCR